MEVKYRRVRLIVDGDQWRYEKMDRYGNIVETGWAVDGGGRSWSRQVNAVADDLAAWLERNRIGVPVYTAVVLMREGAVLGRCQNLTVSLIATNPGHLLEAIAEHPPLLNSNACEEITRLIRRDHRCHATRRAGK